MAILKIARMGNPVLKKVASPVLDILGEDIAGLASDMRETLGDIGGNGLAAPQVHVNKRVVLYRITKEQIPRGSTLKPVDWQVLINPVITPLTDEKRPIWERCLSLPGLHGLVPRYTEIELKAKNLDGVETRIVAAGFHAMLLQHECDHLDGILYPTRMSDLSTLAFNSELGEKGFLIPRDPAEFTR
ncbi:MAG: peptide deformylase [Gammaproteobacteria bacterium]|jgi:peptide deformylase